MITISSHKDGYSKKLFTHFFKIFERYFPTFQNSFFNFTASFLHFRSIFSSVETFLLFADFFGTLETFFPSFLNLFNAFNFADFFGLWIHFFQILKTFQFVNGFNQQRRLFLHFRCNFFIFWDDFFKFQKSASNFNNFFKFSDSFAL